MTLDADLVGTAINVFMEDRQAWEGTATELLDALGDAVNERTQKAKGWPAAAHVLSAKLKRSATALRSHGIEVTFPQRTGKQKLIHLEKVDKKSVTSFIKNINEAQDIDMITASQMTLSQDGRVTEASREHKERHTDRMDDALNDGNDAHLFRRVTKVQDKTDNISNNYEDSDDHDGNDASITPLFQSDDLRRGDCLFEACLNNLNRLGLTAPQFFY